MESDFQTSFIPKKPMIEESTVTSRPAVGFLTILSIFIFISVALASGGLYFYKNILNQNITDMQGTLKLAEGRLESDKIQALQLLDKRLRSANEVLLNNHIAVSPIFDALAKSTLKNIRYTKFGYDLGTDQNSKVNIKMSGQAVGYRSIALQSDIFSTNKNIIDPVFSNLTLDNKTGNVMFDLAFSVDPTFVDYKQMLKTQSSNTQN